MLLKTLNPVRAVLTIQPRHCACQCNSLMSFWPWCMKSNCGGTEGSSAAPSIASVSRSTAKSHNVNWLSDPDAANTVLSCGCHSTDVIGAVWCLNMATGWPLCKWNRYGVYESCLFYPLWVTYFYLRLFDKCFFFLKFHCRWIKFAMKSDYQTWHAILNVFHYIFQDLKLLHMTVYSHDSLCSVSIDPGNGLMPI